MLVAFEHGDIRFPYVLGALWNGKDKSPETNQDGKNNIRVLKSRSGHVIRLNDEVAKRKSKSSIRAQRTASCSRPQKIRSPLVRAKTSSF